MTLHELTALCKAQRIKLNLTQTQVGEKLGVPKNRISEFENNKSNLQLDKLLKLLNNLNLTISIAELKSHQAETTKQAPTPAQRDNNTTQSLKTASQSEKTKEVTKEPTKAELLKQMLKGK